VTILLSRSVRVLTSVVLMGLVLVGQPPAKAQAQGGDEVWINRYNSGPFDSDAAFAVATSPDGSKVVVTGASAGNYATFAYDATSGGVLWVRRQSGSDVAFSPDGALLFVTGSNDGDIAIVAHDVSTGAVSWMARYDGPANGFDSPSALAVSSDGSKVFVTGGSEGTRADYYDYATVAFDSRTGAMLWARRYNGNRNLDDYGESIAVSPDGSTVFVTGSSDENYATIAYDAVSGVVRWVKWYDGPGHSQDYARSIAVGSDGSTVFVTGDSRASSDNDYATIAYDAVTGVTRWVRRYDGTGGGNDVANALAVRPDGAVVFVTGESWGPSSPDFATVAYDASTGALLWTGRYDGADDYDFATAVAVSPDGSRVYVTGASARATNHYDYATVAYDASTGMVLWARRYNGPGDTNDFDAARSVAVSPDGSKVFVTGESRGAASDDYATIAYEA
jgi:WD40 repeat protein